MSPRWQHDIYDVMMFFGLILTGCSVYFIQHDLYSFSKKLRNAELDIIVLIVVVAVIILGIPITLATVWGDTGNFLRVLCFLSGFIFLYPAIITFTRRSQFLE